MSRKVVYLRSAAVLLVLAIGSMASASAVLFGNYYRLGDNDPGAAAGNVGNQTTEDLGAWKLGLWRTGTPRYSADVSPFAVGSKLSMQFVNLPFVVPPGGIEDSLNVYARTSPGPVTLQAAYGLETWVKPSTLEPVDFGGYALIAATPDFGLYQHGGEYVARVGTYEKVIGPASTTAWTHLAYVRMYDQEEFFLNGVSVGQGKSGTALVTEASTLMIGGNPFMALPHYMFNGWIDETRLFTYNPLSAGAFGPGDFLISVPEPGTMLLVGCCAVLAMRRGRRVA